VRLLQSMVGRKIMMSVTGFFLVCFLAVHLLGNSTIYYGPAGINEYMETLRGFGAFIWLLRIVMFVFLSLHIFFGVQLTLENRKAKPEKYALTKKLRSTFAARNMIWTGLLTASFLVYHLLHFSFQVTPPEISANRHLDVMGRTDFFTMVVLGFRSIAVSSVYILALSSLALHLSHGIQSMFQSLGLNTEKTELLMTRAGFIAAIVLFLGFISIPVAVIAGIVR
jgi:succinate dehydrogenase / fumarate reductase cytochrome b subunit